MRECCADAPGESAARRRAGAAGAGAPAVAELSAARAGPLLPRLPALPLLVQRRHRSAPAAAGRGPARRGRRRGGGACGGRAGPAGGDGPECVRRPQTVARRPSALALRCPGPCGGVADWRRAARPPSVSDSGLAGPPRRRLPLAAGRRTPMVQGSVAAARGGERRGEERRRDEGRKPSAQWTAGVSTAWPVRALLLAGHRLPVTRTCISAPLLLLCSACSRRSSPAFLLARMYGPRPEQLLRGPGRCCTPAAGPSSWADGAAWQWTMRRLRRRRRRRRRRGGRGRSRRTSVRG